MKKQTKTIILSIALCLIFALGVFCVYSLTNFTLSSGGSIKFIAPGIDATISEATLTGLSKKSGSGQMQSFTITPQMTTAQIQELSGYKSWSGIKLLFDEETQGKATISFTITNNSSKSVENIMVELSSSTTDDDKLQVIPSADFCIGPNQNHTFTIDFYVSNMAETLLQNYELVVKLNLLKPEQVTSVSEYSTNNGFTFSTNSTTRTATFTNCSNASLTTVELPAVIKDNEGKLFTVTEIKSASYSSIGPFYASRDTLTSVKFPSTLTTIGVYAFSNCNKLTGDFIIPNSVKEIGNYAFSSCGGFTGDLIIPNSVKAIGNYAFAYCNGFTGDLIIPNSVETIGYNAFYSGSFAGELSIGSGVATIGEEAFMGQSSFSAITVSESNLMYQSISNCLVENSTKSIILGCINSIIPNTPEVTTIGNYAFENVGFTGTFTIPSGIKKVGKDAFDGTKITGLVFENGVEIIESQAFKDCDLKGDLFIPQSVTYIAKDVFFWGQALFDSISVDSRNEYYYSVGNCLISKQDKVLIKGCSNSEIPENEGILEIATCAFYGVSTIASFVIPNTVETIGSYAFYSCDKITGQLVVPDSVVSIEADAFTWCDGFSGELIIGEGFERIQDKAFKYCRGISSVVIKSKKTIRFGDKVFEYSYKINSITFYAETPPTLSFSSNKPLANMSGLTTVYVPSASVDTYKSATYWSTLASKIQPIAA